MGFQESVVSAFKNALDFKGRASRAEYWYFVLFTVIISLIVGVIDGYLFGTASLQNDADLSTPPLSTPPLSLILNLVLLVPSFSLGFRRLHDIEKSAWWLLIALIPLVGVLVLLYWAAQPGDKGKNQYGDNPLG